MSTGTSNGNDDGTEIYRTQVDAEVRFSKTLLAAARYIGALTIIIGGFFGLLQGSKAIIKGELILINYRVDQLEIKETKNETNIQNVENVINPRRGK